MNWTEPKNERLLESMKLKKGQKIYYIRKVIDKNCYDLYDCKVRTIFDKDFVVLDKHSRMAFLLSKNQENEIWFRERGKALEKIYELEA